MKSYSILLSLVFYSQREENVPSLSECVLNSHLHQETLISKLRQTQRLNDSECEEVKMSRNNGAERKSQTSWVDRWS